MTGSFPDEFSAALKNTQRRPTSPSDWDDFYRLLYPRIYRLFSAMGVAPPTLIQDLTQEVFFRFLRSSPWRDNWQGGVLEPAAVLSYLRQISKNLWTDHLKRASSSTQLLEDAEALVDEKTCSSDWLSDPHLSCCLERLEADEQRMIRLRYLEQLSLSEISLITGLSRSAISTRLSRLRKKLRKLVYEM